MDKGSPAWAGIDPNKQLTGEISDLGQQSKASEWAVKYATDIERVNAEIAKASIERADGAGKLSRQLLFLTQSNFDLGLSESKDLVDAVQSFLTTRGEYFEAVYNYNVACAKFDMKLGRTPWSKNYFFLF